MNAVKQFAPIVFLCAATVGLVAYNFQAAEAPPVPSEAATGGSAAETYTATAAGFGGDLTVEVVLDGGSIVSVSVVDHSETPDFFDLAVPTVPNRIIENQSTDVDTASGATATSNAIIEAVADAIAQAG